MRLLLVPVGHGCHIILAFKQATVVYADLLDGDADVLLKQDGVHDVPAVKAALGHLVIVVVVIMNKSIVVGIVGVRSFS